MTTKQIRLDRYLADAGIGTRSEVKKYIRSGRIRVDDQAALSPDQKINPDNEILFDGHPVQSAPDHVYYLLNKPAGYLSATEDRNTPTVLDLVPSDPRRKLFPVGRLDKDTEGLLLITDDGDLAHRLLSPRNHVDKTYYALLQGELTPAHIRLFSDGIDIGEKKPALPAVLEILSVFPGSDPPSLRYCPSAEVILPEGTCSEALITIREGKYHQIKRMAAAVGCQVLYLKRLSMGSCILPPDLRTGDYLQLKDPFQNEV